MLLTPDTWILALTWFLWGGLATTAAVGWVRVLDWSMVRGVGLAARQVATAVLFLLVFLGVLSAIVHLDVEARDPPPSIEQLRTP